MCYPGTPEKTDAQLASALRRSYELRNAALRKLQKRDYNIFNYGTKRPLLELDPKEIKIQKMINI
ncbi:hypothetical protein KGP36_03045 [Patescibacteria group bacterium]|nr:hypothetical protein [Patescibacteria group bacterium]